MNANSLNRTRLKKRLFKVINEKTKLLLINEFKKSFNRTFIIIVSKHYTSEKMIKKTKTEMIITHKKTEIEINY